MKRAPDWERFVSERLRSDTQNLYEEAVHLMDEYLIDSVLKSTGGDTERAARILGVTAEELGVKVSNLKECEP